VPCSLGWLVGGGVTHRSSKLGMYSSEVQQPRRAMAIMSSRPHTRHAGPRPHDHEHADDSHQESSQIGRNRELPVSHSGDEHYLNGKASPSMSFRSS
jgi:hypothetical protein